MIRSFPTIFERMTRVGTEGLSPGLSKRVWITNQIGFTLGLLAVGFVFYWLLMGNLKMALSNVPMAIIHFLIPYFNYKKFHNLTRFFICILLATFIFIFVASVGKVGDSHISFYFMSCFSILMFEPKERLKMALAVLYPLILFILLVEYDFKLFPNMIGQVNTNHLPYINYVINFLVVMAATFYLCRATEKSENEYRILYEKHVEAQKIIDENRSKAIYSMKMASLGEMAGGIAHEINSPLNVITMLSEQLERRIPQKKVTDEMMLDSVSKISATAHKIGDIVRSLRSFSRNTDGLPMQEAEVKTILDETLILCQERFRARNIQLKVESEPDLPKVMCRPVEVGQVLLNLLNNACDAVVGVSSPKIQVQLLKSENRLSVCVSDNGSGIPQELREKIFLPFYTTKDVGAGTGLGLSISKSLIESNQGRLFLDASCEFTRFVIELPTRARG